MTVLGSKCSFGNCTFSSPGYDGINVGTTWGSRLSLVGCEFIGVPLDLNLYDMNDTVSVTGCTFEGRQARLSVLPSEWVTQLDPEGQVPRNGTVSGNVLTGPGVDMVVHRLVRDRLLGENLLVDGARAYVLFEPEVVIHEVNPGIGYNITTLDSILYQRSGPMSSYREGTRLNYLVDVTEDPLDPTDPGAVPVVVRIAWNHRGPEGGVVGVANVAIASPQVTVSVMDWGNIQFELRLLTENLDIEDNWWTR
jgi:hypothetical protein